MLVRIGIAANMQGVSPSTLRRWEREEKMLPCMRTRGGHRRYKLSKMRGKEKEEEQQHQQVVVGYARVSGAKQKKELITQQERLRTFARQQGWEIEKIFTDIASGMNDQRKGLHKLLQAVATKQPFAVLCTYEDRIARFGTKVINRFCQIFDTKVISVYRTQEQAAENKLVEDMIALVTSFAGRLHRQRRGKAPPMK
ncbi:MAG: IS607 family transposase [Candidatus Heimdallarchaeota archaeon]|nr:IS607 family transposase [Candidatus Heimdallarchaeota archaeon]